MSKPVSTLVLLLTSLSAVLLLQPAQATPPRPPAAIVFNDRDWAYAVDRKELGIKLRIRASGEISASQLTISWRRLDENKPAVESERPQVLYDQKIDLARDKEGAAINAPLRLPGPGRYEVDIRLRGTTKDGSGFSDRMLRYIVIDDKGGYRILTSDRDSQDRSAAQWAGFERALRDDPKHPRARLLSADSVAVPKDAGQKIKPFDVPADRQLLVRPTQPSGIIMRYTVDRSAQSWGTRDPITVRGRVMFTDIDGSWRPLVNVSVYLWDEDTFGDEYLGAVATGWDGRWSFSVNNDDGFLADGRDIYYTFALENTRLRVKKSNGDVYRWKSAVHDDLSDGTVLDFGEETGVQDPNSMQVWSTLNLAWNHAATTAGLDPGFVDAVYPGSGTFFNGAVNVLGSDNDGPDSITHEYGHALMDLAYASEGGDPSPGGDHGFDDCGQNTSLSWSEGWATAFMLSVRPDGRYNWHEGDAGRAIENFSSGCRTGESSEGWVAATVLDLIDSGNDDNGGTENRGRNGYSDGNAGARITLATIFRDTMWGNFHSYFLNFWSSLAGELSGPARDQAGRIVYYNWMSVLEPGSCVATKVATRDVRDADALLAGLRSFRDQALKPTDSGRDLIKLYNRNSPELAVIIFKDEKLRADCVSLMQYFSQLGSAVTRHTAYMDLAAKDQPVVTADMWKLIDSVTERIDSAASPELKLDLQQVRQLAGRVQGRTLEQIQSEMSDEAAGQRPPMKKSTGGGRLNPASSRALKSPQLRDFIKQQSTVTAPVDSSPSPIKPPSSEKAEMAAEESPSPSP